MMRTTGLVTLTLHTLAVLLGVAYFVLSVTVYATPDANIGAGLGLLWVGTFGLPWSWPAINGTGDLDGATQLLTIFGGAALNLALHALVVLWIHRRSRVS